MTDNEYILDPEELAPPKTLKLERRAEIDEQTREAAELCREIIGMG